ncbi:hypothetical protein E2562_037501 [Oryza meyeriana var. granulata]|uniref:Uncharacterized protein n=1 Tax=Oryza meyeriana var. granulata TaxID=110450 RepID=A0A6G1E8F9_9ORYZ|nr:hypothetical protein E2562_037501 [Oryza meyeriana var. granulata]
MNPSRVIVDFTSADGLPATTCKVQTTQLGCGCNHPSKAFYIYWTPSLLTLFIFTRSFTLPSWIGNADVTMSSCSMAYYPADL